MTRRLFTLPGLALCLVAPAAHAEEPSDLDALLDESVITTASKRAELGTTAPAISTTVTAEDLQRYGIHTLEEAITYLSLGMSGAGGSATQGASAEIGARGVLLTGDSNDHVLLLVNGHTLNEQYVGAARFDRAAGIPLEMVDHIEVIVGPGSVLYGSNAMLGVVNVITKRAKDFRGLHLVIEPGMPLSGRALGGMGTRFELFGAPAELTLAVEYFERRGPRWDLGPQNVGIDRISQEPTITRRSGGPTGIWGGTITDSSYERVPSGELRLIVGNVEVNLHAHTAERGLPFSGFDFDDANSGFRERSAWIDVKHHAVLSSRVELTTRAYADTYDSEGTFGASRRSLCYYTGAQTCDFRVRIASQWAGLELQSSFDWLADSSLVTLVGIDGRARFAGTKTDTVDFDTGEYLDSSTAAFEKTDETFGAYLQQTWEPARWLGLNAGVRVDRDPRFDPVLSPRVAASIGVWQGGTLRGIYAGAFRAPNWFESDYSNQLRVRADALRPETERSTEMSIEQKLGTHRLLFGVFRTDWTDLVKLHQLTPAEAQQAAAEGKIGAIPTQDQLLQFRNVSEIESYGYNAAYSGATLRSRLAWGLNVTTAVTRASGEGAAAQPPVGTPQLFGNARVSYDLSGGLPTLALGSAYLGRRAADQAYVGNFQPVPYAPPQLLLRATISGSVPGMSGLSYRLIGVHATAGHAPYVIGPSSTATPLQPSAELEPVSRWQAFVTLKYEVAP